MTDEMPPHPALLPSGLRDLLPPDAEAEAAAVGTLMGVFASHGYQRVKPPLLEFEDGLLAGAGAAITDQTFRVMDPDTHRMLGLRADMTPQVARIASSRMAHAPRPLRLSYAGQCLRTRAVAPTPDRQLAQAGIELIGADSPDADAEAVLVAAEALAAVGLVRISVDLTMPPLAPALLDLLGLTGAARQAMMHAIDRKDAAVVSAQPGPIPALLTQMLLVAGPVDAALSALACFGLPAEAAPLVDRLRATVAAIQRRSPNLRLTLDPLEFRGFRYHTGVCATIYAPGRHEELGRGGRYVSGNEPATGITLFPDAVLRACPAPSGRPRVFVPWDTSPGLAAQLRQEGFATVAALGPADDSGRLGCTHVVQGATAVPV